MTTLVLQNGPVFIARRKSGGNWEINDQGFATVAEAQAEIAVLERIGSGYEYSWTDMSDVKPVAINKTTGTSQ